MTKDFPVNCNEEIEGALEYLICVKNSAITVLNVLTSDLSSSVLMPDQLRQLDSMRNIISRANGIIDNFNLIRSYPSHGRTYTEIYQNYLDFINSRDVSIIMK